MRIRTMADQLRQSDGEFEVRWDLAGDAEGTGSIWHRMVKRGTAWRWHGLDAVKPGWDVLRADI